MRTLPFNRELRTDPRQLLHNHRGRRGPQRKNRSARPPASHFKLDTCRPPAGTPFTPFPPFSPAAPPHLWLVTCHVSLITCVLVTCHLSLVTFFPCGFAAKPGARRQSFRRAPLPLFYQSSSMKSRLFSCSIILRSPSMCPSRSCLCLRNSAESTRGRRDSK
jgi:hypothetical protein